MRLSKHTVAFGTLLLAVTVAAPATAQDFRPESAECIAPAKPGGGWDLTCRATARLLTEFDLIDSPMQVRNMPGGGGGVAFMYTVGEQGENDDLLVAASGGTTLMLARGELPDVTSQDVRWVGAMGADFPVIAVRADAPWQTLEEFLQQLRDDPRSIVMGGGSAIGGTDHIRPLQLARAAGIQDVRNLRYISFEAGTAVTELLAGRSHVFTAGVSEIAPQFEAGEVRILAVMAPERLPGEFSEIPTATEQGYDVVGPNWRGFYAPSGMSDEAYDFWVGVLEQIETSDEWADVRLQNGLAPLWMAGQEFDDYVNSEVATFIEFATELGIIE
ncbi:MAG: tripartite tricarboxylate transporter substrate binding protein [Roseitalea sp.]|jgi:putative tricarboxylic transport membrane protein|nr:tripartite tricarboxylate transporter substrate binding protein [Roseitalea sp.]MBO6720778.1 tripartite tricarboxylate transporter substrate binding protein [Roseitalea sp.]MBO6743925.1 tripartite tricarboxylate transporter substrate binding protein [Roseitalea sp.]